MQFLCGLVETMLLQFQGLTVCLKVLEEVLLLSNGIKQRSITPLPIQEAMDELLRIADVSITPDLVVGTFDLTIFGYDAFHLVLEEALQEEVGHQDVQTLLLLLQFFTHRPHHHLLQLTSSLLPADGRLLPSLNHLIEGIYLSGPFDMFIGDGFFNRLEHVPATVTDLSLVELLLPQASQFNTLLLKSTVLVEVALPHDEDVMLESLLQLLVDVQVVDAGLDQSEGLVVLLLAILEVLNEDGGTLRVPEMCCCRWDSSSFRASHNLRCLSNSASKRTASVRTSSYRLRVSATSAANSSAQSGRFRVRVTASREQSMILETSLSLMPLQSVLSRWNLLEASSCIELSKVSVRCTRRRGYFDII